MTLTARPFTGSNFFNAIRTEMDKDRGFFGGVDGAMRYVCMDAVFYKLGAFIRPTNQTFTAAAVAAMSADPAIRVVANGQMFGKKVGQVFGRGGVPNYNYTGPGLTRVPDWHGEVIDGKTVLKGDPPTAPGFRHLGQWDGCAELSFGVATGNPSSVTTPAAYNSALGRLLPLVEKKVAASAGTLGTFMTEPATTGKPVYGLHRSTQIVFVLVQQDGAVGPTVATLISQLIAMGVEDAVLGDGSNSAALVVDGITEVTPSGIKNNSIPVGPMFRFRPFKLDGKRTLIRNSALSTDSDTKKAINITGTQGTLSLTNAGLELTISSIGMPTGMPAADFLKSLGVTLPLRLIAPSGTITTGLALSAKGVTGRILLTPNQTDDGKIQGQLNFTVGSSSATYDFDWQIVDGP